MFPPTPAPSTDIAPKPPPSLSNVELSFQLPPPAICNPSVSSSPSSLTSLSASQDALVRAAPVLPAKKRHSKQKYPPSPSSPGNPSVSAMTSIYTPIAPMPTQPTSAFSSDKSILPPPSPSQSVKRSSAQPAAAISQQKRKEREEDSLEQQLLIQTKQQKTCSNSTPKGSAGGGMDSSSSSVTLPPPPGRSRKIIQMRPKPMSSDATVADSTRSSSSPASKAKSSSGGRKKAAINTATVTPQPQVQAPKPTAATRKTARKTAHSLIERRRRFKMNEEFAVLKSMIPACRGVEMHKLAILQASIEYLRYLEECVEKLKKRVGSDGVVGTVPCSKLSNSGTDLEQGLEHLEDVAAMVDRDSEDGEEDDREEKEHYDPNIDPGLNTSAGGSENHLDTSLTFVQQLQDHQQTCNHHSPYQGLLHAAPPLLPHLPSQRHPLLPSNQSSPSIPQSPPSHSHKQHTPKHKNQFINTQNIPQELLPPPILSPTTFKCPSYSISAAQPVSSSSTPWVNPQPNSTYSHASPVLAASSHSRTSSVVASPRTFALLQTPTDEQVNQGRDVDREATHALLLLADGGNDGDRRQQSAGPRTLTRGRTMSVRDLLSS